MTEREAKILENLLNMQLRKRKRLCHAGPEGRDFINARLDAIVACTNSVADTLGLSKPPRVVFKKDITKYMAAITPRKHPFLPDEEYVPEAQP